MTEKQVSITIVIPVHNRKEDTLHCLRQLRAIDRSNMSISIVVVDDGSTDGTSDSLRSEFPEVVLCHGDGNLWWSGATNRGVEYALEQNSDFVLTLNNDVEMNSDFLVRLLESAQAHSNVIVCGVICERDNKSRIISAGRFAKGFLGYDFSGYLAGKDISFVPKEDYESDIESGYAMLIPSNIFRNSGMFDGKKFPQNMGDMDFVLRARKKGAKVIINPKAVLYAERSNSYFHSMMIHESLSSVLKSFFQIKSTVHLRTRWNFCWNHTQYYLGWLSFLYFVVRMCCALAVKLLFPDDIIQKIMKARSADLTLRKFK